MDGARLVLEEWAGDTEREVVAGDAIGIELGLFGALRAAGERAEAGLVQSSACLFEPRAHRRTLRLGHRLDQRADVMRLGLRDGHQVPTAGAAPRLARDR